MTRQDIEAWATDYVDSAAGNRIPEGTAMDERCIGLRLYEAPIVAYGDARDPMFERLRAPEAVGPHHLMPRDWIEDARTVVSFFLPFTRAVKDANARDLDWPSNEWLHARIEGQAFVAQLSADLCAWLEVAGAHAVVPALDARARAAVGTFTSGWSERHVAHICGLGTFGLSKGLITRKGVAGRFGSVVTSLEMPPTERDYEGLYDYCIGCGACARRCPAHAIDPHTGKAHPPCSDFLDRVRSTNAPYYGCGKCQVGVPCQDRAPTRSA